MADSISILTGSFGSDILLAQSFPINATTTRLLAIESRMKSGKLTAYGMARSSLPLRVNRSGKLTCRHDSTGRSRCFHGHPRSQQRGNPVVSQLESARDVDFSGVSVSVDGGDAVRLAAA